MYRRTNVLYIIIRLVLLRRERPSCHPSVRKCQRHTQPGIFTLVAFVKVQTNAKTLQIGVGMGGQHKQKRLHKVLYETIKVFNVMVIILRSFLPMYTW
jgi:hypothetical protein